MRINPKYVNLTFATLMSCVMSLIMTCFITALNTGLDANFFMRWAMAWSVAWPVAFLCNFLLAARLRRWVAARAIATGGAWHGNLRRTRSLTKHTRKTTMNWKEGLRQPGVMPALLAALLFGAGTPLAK